MNTTTVRNSNSARRIRLARPREGGAQIVHLEFTDSAAGSVAIAGTFNDWRAEVTPMIPTGEGHWVKELVLPPGTYEYCVVVDGTKWLADPQAEGTAPNPFGGRNSVLEVPGPRTEIR